MGDETMTYGEHGRPLWDERDRQAEAIRKVLRAARCLEWLSERPAGFVVEGESPFGVACAGADTDAKRARAEQRYAQALVKAGYAVSTDPDGYGLLVELAS